jgi:hypothetical protein
MEILKQNSDRSKSATMTLAMERGYDNKVAPKVAAISSLLAWLLVRSRSYLVILHAAPSQRA